MSEFKVHTIETAPGKSKPVLEGAGEKFGFVPNLLGVLAEAPAAAEGYMKIAGAFAGSSLSAAEQQVVLLAASRENGCDYCMAAHSAIVAGRELLDPASLDRLRDGRALGDERLEALRRFTTHLVESRGWIDDGELDRFLKAGYGRAQVLEVIVGVAQKVISNYTNHIAATRLDRPFEKFRWEKTAAD